MNQRIHPLIIGMLVILGFVIAVGYNSLSWTTHYQADASFALPRLPYQLPRPEMTGVWQANDGGTYYMREIHSEGRNLLWWFGRSPDNGATWTNVFRGEIINTTSPSLYTVSGEWIDLPWGSSRGAGTLTLDLYVVGRERGMEMEKRSGTGSGFAGSEWKPLPWELGGRLPGT